MVAMRRYAAAIFDMDGLLLDSEPHWDAVIETVLGEQGMVLTEAMRLATVGMRLEETLGLWRSWFPGVILERDAIGRRLSELMRERMASVAPKPGAAEAVVLCRSAGLRLAVASSSPEAVIAAGLARLRVADHFDAVVSADGEPHGKPHPAVFLSAARALGVEPSACIAFEDSLNGVKAALAAGMHCVAVPEAHNRHRPEYAVAHFRFESLLELRAEYLVSNG